MPREISAFAMFMGSLVLATLMAIQASPVAARPPEMSAAEKYATDGGRTLGAANACGFDSEEIVIAMKQVMDVARQRAINKDEREAVQSRFAEGLKSGVESVRSGQTTCINTRDELTMIEDEAFPR